MYNRYVPAGQQYQSVAVERDQPEGEQTAAPDNQKYTQARSTPQADGKNFNTDSKNKNVQGLWELFGRDKFGGIGALLRSFGLEELDTGDVLLFLIILFLLSEGDELDLLITLGLSLLMGLGGEKRTGIRKTDSNPDAGKNIDLRYGV